MSHYDTESDNGEDIDAAASTPPLLPSSSIAVVRTTGRVKRRKRVTETRWTLAVFLGFMAWDKKHGGQGILPSSLPSTGSMGTAEIGRLLSSLAHLLMNTDGEEMYMTQAQYLSYMKKMCQKMGGQAQQRAQDISLAAGWLIGCADREAVAVSKPFSSTDSDGLQALARKFGLVVVDECIMHVAAKYGTESEVHIASKMLDT